MVADWCYSMVLIRLVFISFQVYCCSHVPKTGPGHLDQTSVGIRQALNVPKSTNYVNEQIRGLRSEVDGKLRVNHSVLIACK